MKADLKVIPTEPETKILDAKSMIEITGKVQKRDHLTPPYFPDATAREVELTPFKKRLLELWKGNNS